MKSRFRVRAALASLAFALGVVGPLQACSSDDSAAPGTGGPDATSDAFDLCATFTHSGDTCSVASNKPCFKCGTSGGCYCTQGPTGLRWMCVTDDACVPGPGVLDDAGNPITDDGGPIAPPPDAGHDANAPDTSVADGNVADTAAPDTSADDASDGAAE